MAFFRGIFCVIVVFIAVACVSVTPLVVNVQKPAHITIPPEISKTVVVNNSVDQPADVGHRVFQFQQLIGDTVVNADSLGFILTGAMAQFLGESEFFDNVDFESEPLRHDQSFLQEGTLDNAAIQSICDKWNADAIISLDRFIVLTESDKNRLGNGLMMNTLSGVVQAKFSMYKKNGTRISAPVLFQDTLIWQELSQGEYVIDSPLPSRRDALKESALYVATSMENYFVPRWEDVERVFYTDGSTDMKKAAAFANGNKWDDAQSMWESLYDREKNVRKKAKLAANIALSYEIADNLEQSLEWTNIAHALFEESKRVEDDMDLNRTLEYKKSIEGRIQDSKLLDLQLGHN